jgi:Tol biopolymer transport system component
MRRIGAINVMSVGVVGATVVIFVYVILIRPTMAGNKVAQEQATPSTEATDPSEQAPTDIPVLAATATATPEVRERIAFVMSTDEMETFNLYAVEPDGSNLTLLAENVWADPILDWSSDGNQLLFVSLESGTPHSVYAIDANGTNLTYWMSIDHEHTYILDGTLEGNSVLYLKSNGEGDCKISIRIAEPPSTEREIASLNTCRFGISSSWQEIAYLDGSQNQDSDIELLKIVFLETNETRSIPLYGLGMIESQRWSPDGSKITLIAESSKTELEAIYIVDLEKDALIQKIMEAHIDTGLGIRWSPNGQYIAFCVYEEDGECSLNISEPDGSNLRSIARDIYAAWFNWSPDSTRIVTTTMDSEGFDRITVIPIDGSDMIVVSPANSMALFPVWSPHP